MKDLLAQAMKHNETVKLFYMDHEKQVTERFVRVVKLQDDRVLAYCFWRKQIRLFKMERILSVGQVSGHKYIS